jgi:hypothetical protein
VGFQRAIEVDNRRTDSRTVLGVGKRPIVGQPDASPAAIAVTVSCVSRRGRPSRIAARSPLGSFAHRVSTARQGVSAGTPLREAETCRRPFRRRTASVWAYRRRIMTGCAVWRAADERGYGPTVWEVDHAGPSLDGRKVTDARA